MSSTASTVYTGFWINWSYGRVHGSTITLSAQSSAFLIAFIALFVRLAGGQLWAVLAFLASLVRSKAGPQDALYHQQQAILRNTSSPATVLWSMLKLSWFWKGSATRARSRTFSFVFTGLVYIASFSVAGIFSSRITSANSEVVLSPSKNCGYWPFPYIVLWDPAKASFLDYEIQRHEWNSEGDQFFRKSHSFVADCYNNSLENPNDSCLPFGRSRISWSTDLSAACPFDDDMCMVDAIKLDTGFLDSRTHFGINSGNDRIEYRRVMTCAPITTDGYKTDFLNASSLSPDIGNTWEGEMFQKYTYGQNIIFDDNTTYAYSDESFSSSEGYWWPFNEYALDVELSLASPDEPDVMQSSTFTAIPSLSRPDADTTLIFLSSNGTYLSEVRDPWFWATNFTTINVTTTIGTSITEFYFTADLNAPVGVMGCTEQHQLRNSITGATSALGGMEIVTNQQAQTLGFNDNQLAIFNRSFVIASQSVLTGVVPALGGSYLLAQAYQSAGVSIGLSDHQWQLEMNHYFGVALNTIQLWSQQYVVGPGKPEMDQYIVPPAEGFEKAMCFNQIARRTDYRSFSVLGLCTILVFGLLVIIANLTIRLITENIQGHTLHGRYRNAEWQANDLLQLQRMAYEHSNIGTWKGQHDMVPRTNPGEVFTLPESTKWEQGRPAPAPNNDRPGVFRSWSRGWSYGVQSSQSHVTGSNSSASKMDEKHTIATTDVEKGVQASERQVKE